MIDETEIADAIDQIREQLIKGADPKITVTEAAEGFEINETVLKNRAKVSLGDLATLKDRHESLEREYALSAKRLDANAIESAKRLASSEAGRLFLEKGISANDKLLGRVFDLHSEPYVFIARTQLRRKWTTFAISTSQQRMVVLSEDNWATIAEQIIKRTS